MRESMYIEGRTRDNVSPRRGNAAKDKNSNKEREEQKFLYITS